MKKKELDALGWALTGTAGGWVGGLTEVGGRVREGKPSQVRPNLEQWSQRRRPQGRRILKASPHAADPNWERGPETITLIRVMVIPSFVHIFQVS